MKQMMNTKLSGGRPKTDRVSVAVYAVKKPRQPSRTLRGGNHWPAGGIGGGVGGDGGIGLSTGGFDFNAWTISALIAVPVALAATAYGYSVYSRPRGPTTLDGPLGNNPFLDGGPSAGYGVAFPYPYYFK